jgi:hypothetical protein
MNVLCGSALTLVIPEMGQICIWWLLAGVFCDLCDQCPAKSFLGLQLKNFAKMVFLQECENGSPGDRGYPFLEDYKGILSTGKI